MADNVIDSQKTFVNWPMDWRTKEPIIIRTSKQWFINTDRIKESALQEVSVFTKIDFPVVNPKTGTESRWPK